jgi:broad specificity phosphatase PhoE
MNAPGVNRGRRSFFAAPVWLAGLAAVVVLMLALASWRAATTTTVIVLRHGEKQLGTIDDPPLSAEGEARALRLAELLGGRASLGRVTAIYASDTRRAEQTALPLAQRLGLTLLRYPGRDIRDLVRRIRRENAGGVVVVIGHSNTVPEIIAMASRGRFRPETLSMADDDFGTIYVLSAPRWAPEALLRLHY